MVNNSFVFGMKQDKPFIALLLTIVILGLVLVHAAWQGSRLVGEWEFVSSQHPPHILVNPVPNPPNWHFDSDGNFYRSINGSVWNTNDNWSIHGPWLRITFRGNSWVGAGATRYRIIGDRLILTGEHYITEFRRVD